ncbi:MAG: hypothetical protein D6701_13700, partial [Gemmatimonadetes bacterium]
YYANSFVCEPPDPGAVVAWSTYEQDRFAAAVRRGNAWGVQFHPEKSSTAGLAVIERWVAEAWRVGRAPGRGAGVDPSGSGSAASGENAGGAA